MTDAEHLITRELFEEIWRGLGGDSDWLEHVAFSGSGSLPSPFAVSDLAAAAFAVVGAAVGELLHAAGSPVAGVEVDRILSSGWFYLPPGPSQPLVAPPPHALPPWMTEFQTADERWVRVQGTFESLRQRILDELGVADDIAAVGALIRRHPGEEIEDRLVRARAAVAVSRTLEEWRAHPAGQSVHAEPVVHVEATGEGSSDWQPTWGRPLAGIKVLDLTRVAAGPFATRFLAACGAEVLRIDAPGSDESNSPYLGRPNDLMLGKRWAFLDLRSPAQRDQFLTLLRGADVLVHGYRPGGIDELVDADERRQANPDLVEVALRAYGWTGPWQQRRGFDTLVQFSSGIANETQAWALEDPERRVPLNAIGALVDASRPRHMPVEALDLASGYQMAAAAIRGLTRRVLTGQGSVWRFSIARTARLLTDRGRVAEQQARIDLPLDGPWEDRIYAGAFGPVRRLRFPLEIEANPLFWERPSESAGASNPIWIGA